MPTAAQLVDVLALMTGERRARVNMMARRLIDDGLMPRSRGRDVAQVDAKSVVNLLFAVAFAEKGADAARTAREWGDLKWSPDEHHDQMHSRVLKKVYGISSKCNLRKAFASVLTLDTHTPMEVHLLNVGSNYNMAKFKSLVSSKELTDLPHEIYADIDSGEKKTFDTYVDIQMEFGAQYADHMNLFARAYLINHDAIILLRKLLRAKDLTSPYEFNTAPDFEADND